MQPKSDHLVGKIQAFLLCETPKAWLESALKNIPNLLIDHANCEKKAASTAVNLMYRYVDDFDLLNKMSRLAREELRHFEQVIAIMEARGIPYENLSASRYASGLRAHVRTHEPVRLIDTLIVGALIEARSCERFARLAPFLDDELQNFYLSLLRSEARHFEDYLNLAKARAKQEACENELEERIRFFCNVEQDLILSPDREFRFHSGPLTA